MQAGGCPEVNGDYALEQMLDMLAAPLADVPLQRAISPFGQMTQNGRMGLGGRKGGKEVSNALVVPTVIDVALATTRHSDRVSRRLRKETKRRDVVMVGRIGRAAIDT